MPSQPLVALASQQSVTMTTCSTPAFVCIPMMAVIFSLYHAAMTGLLLNVTQSS
jgi:hypothetical protein